MTGMGFGKKKNDLVWLLFVITWRPTGTEK